MPEILDADNIAHRLWQFGNALNLSNPIVLAVHSPLIK